MEGDDKACGSAGGKRCGCVCHKLPGLLIALIGFFALLGNVGVISPSLANVAWPVLLIVFGLHKACGKGKCGCCSGA